jgi:3-polyprenyl-4-hydroxybenzoate decarboxylase
VKTDDSATSEIEMGSKLGIDATQEFPSEGLKHPWPPLIRIHEERRKKIDARIGPAEDRQKLAQDVPNALAHSSCH